VKANEIYERFNDAVKMLQLLSFTPE